MTEPKLKRDPYEGCESRCCHNLGRGVLISELLDGEDGPFGHGWRPSSILPRGEVLRPDDHEDEDEEETQRWPLHLPA